MKKRISIPIVFLVHLLVCFVLSFDYPFLHGMYLGLVLTFLIIWGFTLPAITACISVINVSIMLKNRERINSLDIITSVIGCIILLIYLASASGWLKHFELTFVYMFVLFGMLFIFGYWFYKRVKNR